MTDAEKLLVDLSSLITNIRARGGEAEEAGRIPEETIEELKAINAFKAIVPKSRGGMEVDFPYVWNIFRLLGRGCVSTGWCMGFLIYHNYQFAHYSKKAQDEAFASKGYTMAAGLVVPGGEAKIVDGGFILNGRWSWATGILHCDYLALAVPVVDLKDENDMPIIYRFFLPVHECEIHDNWDVAAMKATGSHDVSLKNVFVPEHHAIEVAQLRNLNGPGLKINKGPLYRIPVLTFMAFGTIGPVVGGVEALFEMVNEILKTKIGAYSGDHQAGLMTQRVRFARLKMELDSMVNFIQSNAEIAWEKVKDGPGLNREERAEMRMVIVHAARKCREIADELALVAGSGATYLNSPIQRFHRDISVLTTHAIFEFDHVASMYGGTLMDIDLPSNAMI